MVETGVLTETGSEPEMISLNSPSAPSAGATARSAERATPLEGVSTMVKLSMSSM